MCISYVPIHLTNSLQNPNLQNSPSPHIFIFSQMSLPDFPTTSPPPPPAPSDLHRHHPPFFLPPLLAASLALAFLVFFAVLYRKLSTKRTAPADLTKTLQRFSYSVLRRATSSFAASNRLGQGGFGSVYKGTLDSGMEIAVKLMDASGSLQGEREFHNELSIAARIDTMCCPFIVSVLGFSSDQRSRCRRKLSLVYEYMPNGSLQDALLHRKCTELLVWKVRFGIIVDIAKGIEYLHCSCDPPIVHGDIKPSNILLDSIFNAKIADFGLAKVLVRDGIDETFIECGEDVETTDKGKRRDRNVEDNGSIIEETESLSVMTEEVIVNVDQSPESCVRIFDEAVVSPEMGSAGVEATPSSVSESCFDRFSVDSANNNRKVLRKKSGSGRDWWWKQDNAGEGSESGRVKDYVMEWIGSEIKKERPKKDWIAESTKNEQKKHSSKTLEWWASLGEEKIHKDRKRNRKPREWWREEFCNELTKKRKSKKKKKKGLSLGSGCSGEMWWQRDEDNEELGQVRKKRKSRGSRGSIDWWIDGFSGECHSGRRNSQDCYAGGEIPKSGGISSTPSMRGTVCYIAPEYSGGGLLSEKCDVYSFGVLLLVLVSGRRPLQVTASPISEFERANLISWARQLAHNGRLLDLVDANIQCLNSDQVLLCIKIALLCLQRLPSKRPTMKEIVGILSGEVDAPQLPFEFSPSPPSNFPFKSRRKAR